MVRIRHIVEVLLKYAGFILGKLIYTPCVIIGIIWEYFVSGFLISKGPIIIGHNVWIGDKVTILPNVVIGDSCIIGANSVVAHSFPENSVISGNPAKILYKIE